MHLEKLYYQFLLDLPIFLYTYLPTYREMKNVSPTKSFLFEISWHNIRRMKYERRCCCHCRSSFRKFLFDHHLLFVMKRLFGTKLARRSVCYQLTGITNIHIRTYSNFVQTVHIRYWLLKIGPFPAFFCFHHFNTVNGKLNMPMTGFESRISGIISHCYTNWAITTARIRGIFIQLYLRTMKLGFIVSLLFVQLLNWRKMQIKSLGVGSLFPLSCAVVIHDNGKHWCHYHKETIDAERKQLSNVSHQCR